MTKFTERLWSDLVQEHGPTLAHADRPKPGRVGGAGLLRRPRLLASSTLGLAGVAAALVLALGGSAAPPAFAITKQDDGSVLVKLNYQQNENLPQVNRKLTAMGTHEQIGIAMAPGAATVSGPVTCTPAPGASRPSGPPVKVLVGTDGTEVIGAGQSAGNTAEGTFHLVSCGVYPGHTGLSTLRGYTGNTGNTGAG